MAARPVAAHTDLDIEARLQTAREQFQQRLALIKRDLLLGQAELPQATPLERPGGSGPGGDPWPGEAQPSRVVDSSSFQAGGGDDELTAQVRAWHHSRKCAPERFGARQRESLLIPAPAARAQAALLRESLAGFFDELYPQRETSGGADGGARPMDALEQSRLARERALAHVQALKHQVSGTIDVTADEHRRGSPRARPTVIGNLENSDDTQDAGGRTARGMPARLGPPASRKDAASYQMRTHQLDKARGSGAYTSQRQRYGSVSGLTARKPRGRYRASAWAASRSGRFPPGKEMSDPGAYDPPAGMQLDSNAKFPGGQPLPTAAFDSTSKRFPDHGSIWRPPSDNIPGPGRYDPIDADDWMLDTRRPCYNF